MEIWTVATTPGTDAAITREGRRTKDERTLDRVGLVFQLETNFDDFGREETTRASHPSARERRRRPASLGDRDVVVPHRSAIATSARLDGQGVARRVQV